MDTEKFAGLSKGIVGPLLALLVVILPQLGISFTPEAATVFSGIWDQVIIVVGSAVGIYGRTVAASKIYLIKK